MVITQCNVTAASAGVSHAYPTIGIAIALRHFYYANITNYADELKMFD